MRTVSHWVAIILYRVLSLRFVLRSRLPPIATEGRDMIRCNVDGLFQALILIRMGQELGTDSAMARAVYDIVEVVLAILR